MKESKKSKATKKKESQVENVEYATINFVFPMSRHEANEIIKHPNGKTMKSFMDYMKKIVVSAANKYQTIPVGETVTNCKVPIE